MTRLSQKPQVTDSSGPGRAEVNPAVRRYLRDWRLGELDDTRTQVMAQAQAEATVPEPGLKRLSRTERQVIVERFLAGTTREQLAAEYGVSLSTVKLLLRRAGARRPRWPKQSA
jgi:DNA-directed RNA polymerase specialized sigma24 family protein